MTMNNDSDDKSRVDITVFQVSKPWASSVPGKFHTKPKSEDLYSQKGPFKFQSTDSYQIFLSKIALELPCPVGNFIESRITWRP